ncbi:divalent metal cation transporter [Caballeronia arvi]|nr:divalent metal cation transporter [Caballeronia arvi]
MRGSTRAARSWAADVGPGLVTTASDNDPSGLATYSLAGAWYGFDMLWVCVLTYPLTVALQLIASRVAAITGRGLTVNMREHYSPLFFYFGVGRFLLANTFNIAVDVLAMGIALRVFCGGSVAWLTLASGGASLALQWCIPYARYARVLKWLTLAMFAYVGVILVIDGSVAAAAINMQMETALESAVLTARKIHGFHVHVFAREYPRMDRSRCPTRAMKH